MERFRTIETVIDKIKITTKFASILSSFVHD
jgi:hypothetical protein